MYYYCHSCGVEDGDLHGDGEGTTTSCGREQGRELTQQGGCQSTLYQWEKGVAELQLGRIELPTSAV